MNGSIMGKVLRGTYSFPKSKPDFARLRELADGGNGDTCMNGGSDVEYYAAVFNICTEFGEQLLDNIRQLNDFNNCICDKQEEYMPSAPPMSPVTIAFFNSWLSLDAPITAELTLGRIFSKYIKEKKTMLYAAKAMENLNASVASLYQVTAGDFKRTILWDIINKREIIAPIRIIEGSIATYEPCPGDVWYIRILPPLFNNDLPHAVFGTPLVFRSTGRKDWEDFLARKTATMPQGSDGIHQYLKQGDFIGYWLEFVFQAYIGHTSEVIFAEGLPDIKASRPHGDLDGDRLSKR